MGEERDRRHGPESKRQPFFKAEKGPGSRWESVVPRKESSAGDWASGALGGRITEPGVLLDSQEQKKGKPKKRRFRRVQALSGYVSMRRNERGDERRSSGSGSRLKGKGGVKNDKEHMERGSSPVNSKKPLQQGGNDDKWRHEGELSGLVAEKKESSGIAVRPGGSRRNLQCDAKHAQEEGHQYQTLKRALEAVIQ